MNPEFQRNLILELSIHRLIAMPVILLLVFVATGALAGEDAATYVATGVLWLLLVLWGGRLAAETVLGEVAGRTWDAQRMSSIGPWTMSWGKLFGSTVFVWYGALWCVPAYFWSGQKSFADLVETALLGLFTHAIALFLTSCTCSRSAPRCSIRRVFNRSSRSPAGRWCVGMAWPSTAPSSGLPPR
jgi:hypothetical protein